VGHLQTAKLQETHPPEVLDFQASQKVPKSPSMSRYRRRVSHFFVKLYLVFKADLLALKVDM